MDDCHFSYITKLGEKNCSSEGHLQDETDLVSWQCSTGDVELATYRSHFCKLIKWMWTKGTQQKGNINLATAKRKPQLSNSKKETST